MRAPTPTQASPDTLLAGIRSCVEGIDLTAAPYRTMGACGAIVPSISYPGAPVENPASPLRWLSYAQLPDGQALDLAVEPPPGVELPLLSEKRQRMMRDQNTTQAGDVLVLARLARPGTAIPVSWVQRTAPGFTVVPSNAVHTVRPAVDVVPAYLAWVLRHRRVQQELLKGCQGTNVLMLPRDVLAQVHLPMPDRATQERVVDLVHRVDVARAASRSLASATKRLADLTEHVMIHL